VPRTGQQNNRRVCQHDERWNNHDSVRLVQMQSDVGHGLNRRTPLRYLSRGKLPTPPPTIHILIQVELDAADRHPTKAVSGGAKAGQVCRLENLRISGTPVAGVGSRSWGSTKPGSRPSIRHQVRFGTAEERRRAGGIV